MKEATTQMLARRRGCLSRVNGGAGHQRAFMENGFLGDSAVVYTTQPVRGGLWGAKSLGRVQR